LQSNEGRVNKEEEEEEEEEGFLFRLHKK